jgi:hypothetical protein
LSVAARRGDVLGAAERAPRLRERARHETVPGRQNLVVAPGLHPALARLEQLAAPRRSAFRIRLTGQPENTLALEIRAAVDAPVRHRRVGVRPEHRADLVGRPDEELALMALGVRVLRGVEATGRIGHLAQDVVERLLAHTAALGVAERLPGMQIERSELRVVVKHFLEVRHQPQAIDRIAREAAAQLVVDAAARHLHQRRVHHPPRIGIVAAAREAKHEFPDHRLREFRRAAEPAMLFVELRRHALKCREEDLVAQQGARGTQP